MEATGVAMRDLPWMHKHTDGNINNLCWLQVLGICTHPHCKFIHEKGSDVNDNVVDKLCNKLDRGVCWVVKTQHVLSTNRGVSSPGRSGGECGSYGVRDAG